MYGEMEEIGMGAAFYLLVSQLCTEAVGGSFKDVDCLSLRKPDRKHRIIFWDKSFCQQVSSFPEEILQ